MPAFGRRQFTDDRDRNFPFALAAPPPPARTRRYWPTGKVLDQNGFPHCVAYAWKQWLNSSPIRQAWAIDPAGIYHEAQLIDEWPGEDYEGTSVRAGAKVVQTEGFISQYLWAFSAQEIASWILEKGPVVIGVNWYSGMEDTDAEGFVRASGAILGGHAVLLYGHNHTRGVVRGVNSWSKDWGQGGRFWLTMQDLDRLMSEDGEACTAVEVRV